MTNWRKRLPVSWQVRKLKTESWKQEAESSKCVKVVMIVWNVRFV